MLNSAFLKFNSGRPQFAQPVGRAVRPLLAMLFSLSLLQAPLAAEGWKAGVAKTIITPDTPLWMAGYGSRTEPATGKYHDLWIKAVALEAADGTRGVVLSSDTLGISRPIYDEVAARLKASRGLERSQFMLHASHTHCGPVLKQALYDIYPVDAEQLRQIDAYSAALTDKIVQTIETALDNLQPATVQKGMGQCEFAVNRRTNREPDVPMLREQNLLMGPVDHTVPVLAVHRPDGTLLAVVFSYACHNTVLAWQQWCGDYAGFAQYALEERYPGAVALFAMGCGADQNPLPRRTVELAQGYGNRLADSVDAVLKSSLTPLTPQLQTKLEFTSLRLGPLPPQAKLEEMAKPSSAGYLQRWAQRNLELSKNPEKLIREYAYPVQVWRMGDSLLWITLGGEVVVDYSLRFKSEYGWDTWVSGYCNDVMAYIPSERVLMEGGYEGQSSMYVYGLPSERWAPGIEQQIAETVSRVIVAVRTMPTAPGSTSSR